jgi:hypothetical protein
MQSWRPASPFEQKLLQALTTGDAPAVKALLRGAQLALPMTATAFAGEQPSAWPTITAAERTWIVAYTSMESMTAGTGQAVEHARISSLPELAAGWPDHDWGLAINPGLPIQVPLEAGALARIAAPSLLEDRAAEPGARTPVMQKLLRPSDIFEMLQLGVTRVSGYCHQALDVEHITTPEVLVEALGRKDEIADLITDEGAVNMLRWPAVGLELYRSTFGGTDEASRAAVDGWLIEEQPFVGLGFAPNIDQTIREYKVDGVGLPHGSEICELTDAGTSHRRAVLDVDLGRWLLIPANDESVAVDGRLD